MAELQRAVSKLRSSGSSSEAIQECLGTLHKVAENAAQKWNPTTGAKFRTIKQSSNAIKKKVTDLPGGRDCLLAIGFADTVQDGEPVWHVPQERSSVDKLWDGLAVLRTEKDNMASFAVDTEKSEAANRAGGLEGMIRDMLTSPAKLSQILRNPMVRQMISSNPDMVENFVSSMPEARETLTIYPEMRTQLESVMGRPLHLEDSRPPVPTASTSGTPLPPGGTQGYSGPVTAGSVQALVYDISQGMAKGMSQMLIGKQLDLIPHTGISVFGREYYFGSGPQISDSPGFSVPVPVAQTFVLGETSKTREELESYISRVLALEHTEQNYNLLSHNCNHFANDVAKFLLDGKGVPEHIVNFGQEALSTPQGQQMRAMIENMERSMRQGGSGAGVGANMNPFGGGGSGPQAPGSATMNMNPVGGQAAPPGVAGGGAASVVGVEARLAEMGFSPERGREAAATAGGDFDLALAILLSTS